jgi:hypothetical protein
MKMMRAPMHTTNVHRNNNNQHHNNHRHYDHRHNNSHRHTNCITTTTTSTTTGRPAAVQHQASCPESRAASCSATRSRRRLPGDCPAIDGRCRPALGWRRAKIFRATSASDASVMALHRQ